VAASAVLLGACAFAGTTSLPFLLERLGRPYAVTVSRKATLASIGIGRDGQIVVAVAPVLLHVSAADMLAFLYLHELGHARLGHLRPADPRRTRFFIPGESRIRAWQMEYDADAWAARQALALGYDPLRGIEQLFRQFGHGDGLTHPPDASRLDRVRRIVRPQP